MRVRDLEGLPAVLAPDGVLGRAPQVEERLHLLSAICGLLSNQRWEITNQRREITIQRSEITN